MTNSTPPSPVPLDDLSQLEDVYRSNLRIALDWLRDKKEHLIANPTHMGTTRSYITSVPLRWIASNVSFAKNLPIFKDQRVQGSDRIAINAKTRQDIQQREPDYTRQLPMSVYLAIRQHHKFGPLILVAYKSWVYDKTSDMWGADGRALESSLAITPLDTKAYLVDLDVDNTQYFALDGQHRLMAIQGLDDIVKGRIEAKTKEGKSKPGKSITREQIEQTRQELGLNASELEGLLNESMGIEIMPAVQAGETYKEAVNRLRSVFVDVNENARRLEEGELTLLDVNDGFRIVARILLTTHNLFQPVHDRVNMKTRNVSEKSSYYTTLAHLVDISRVYLYPKAQFDSWRKPLLDSRSHGYLRPPAGEIDAGLQELDDYFSALTQIPSHKAVLQGGSVAEARSQKDNVLFRPIAQLALAEAIATLQSERNKTLPDVVKTIGKYEDLGQMRLRRPDAPWSGVFCDPINGKIRRSRWFQELGVRMFIYLLGGGHEDDDLRESLRKDFFWARRAASEEGEAEKAFDMSGTLVTDDKFHLPDPWQ